MAGSDRSDLGKSQSISGMKRAGSGIDATGPKMNAEKRPIAVEEAAAPSAESARRLAALKRLNLLDSAPEQDFDDITRLIAHICQAPIALVSFVETNRQFFKSHFGIETHETPLSHSICKFAIQQDDVFVIRDTTKDERLRQNPLVFNDPFVRFYAGAPLKLDDGTAIGTLCVLDTEPRELTESQLDSLRLLARHVMSQISVRQKNAEQAKAIERLRVVEADLQTANQSKDRFLAFLSHELRTPLTPVLLTSSAMAVDERLPEDVRSDARMINRNIAMQMRLVDDLLDVTRLASGKLQIKAEPVEVNELIRQSVEICADEARQKQIDVTVPTLACPPLLRGDGLRLQQALINLLKNAVKFTAPGGRIGIEMNVLPSAEANAQPPLAIVVNDSGIGIEPAMLPTIFDAYDQGPVSTTTQFGGLGLGLAIARGIATAHGGTLEARSDGINCGATFTMTLPTMIRPAPADGLLDGTIDGAVDGAVDGLSGKSAGIANAPAASILLVDDHEDTLRAMARLLKRLKHRVVTANSVQSALDAAASENFDIVISDVGLPDGTGMDLMRELLGRHPIHGIAVTGYGMEADVQDTRRAGFSTHLTKPIDVDDLETAIGRLIE